jgi:hypothetical protein
MGCTACEFVRSKSLLAAHILAFRGCGYAADNFVGPSLKGRREYVPAAAGLKIDWKSKWCQPR